MIPTMLVCLSPILIPPPWIHDVIYSLIVAVSFKILKLTLGPYRLGVRLDQRRHGDLGALLQRVWLAVDTVGEFWRLARV